MEESELAPTLRQDRDINYLEFINIAYSLYSNPKIRNQLWNPKIHRLRSKSEFGVKKDPNQIFIMKYHKIIDKPIVKYYEKTNKYNIIDVIE